MKSPVNTLITVMSVGFMSFAITPVEGSAQNLFDDIFNSESNGKSFPGYEHFFSPATLEGIKSELIADKIMNVQQLHGSGNTETKSGNWIGKNFISFAYENTNGPLKFSTGYIYTAAIDENLGLEDLAELGYKEYTSYGHSPDWYLAIDLSHSILLSEDIKLGFDAQISYLVDAFSEQEDKKVSMFFNVPVTLNNSLTISPRFQYTRSLMDDSKKDSSSSGDNGNDLTSKGDFYGGVSISFAY